MHIFFSKYILRILFMFFTVKIYKWSAGCDLWEEEVFSCEEKSYPANAEAALDFLEGADLNPEAKVFVADDTTDPAPDKGFFVEEPSACI